VAAESVISIAERLKQRREELGITQTQAARELDVARTAYRLWELEAAKPAPDRWRLIARWLGVSVTTMLLAEELITEDEARRSEAAEFDYARSGKDWDTVGASRSGDFFAEARELLRDGVTSGDISEDQANGFQAVFDRIAAQSSVRMTGPWKAAELRKQFPADRFAPKHARDAVAVVAVGLASEAVEVAQLLVSELVSNSVLHGPTTEGSTVGLFVGVGRDRLRVEVSDGAQKGARPKPPTHEGGYGLALLAEFATRWGAGRDGDLNITWFELDLRPPGA
jgi:transcriptional regulator with XRE-family HTH domain/anti-sigma regulatory factor (Ser/Thr protein kinase)